MNKYSIKKALVIGIIIILVIIALFPIYWMGLTSIKPRKEMFIAPPKFTVDNPTLDNYKGIFGIGGVAWGKGGGWEAGERASTAVSSFLNSSIIALSSTLLTLVIGSLAAYGFARFNVGGKKLAFWILSTRMFPPIAIIIPFFLLMRQLNLIDTHLALIMAYTMFNLPFAVWIIKGFLEEIPIDLEEAAMIDGASRLSGFIRVTLPLAIPGIIVTGIFCFIFCWNEFMFAVMLTRTSATTNPVELSLYGEVKGVRWGSMMAHALIIVAPVWILVLLIQKHLVRGLTLGALKG